MAVRESRPRPNRVATRAGPIASDPRHFIAAYLPRLAQSPGVAPAVPYDWLIMSSMTEESLKHNSTNSKEKKCLMLQATMSSGTHQSSSETSLSRSDSTNLSTYGSGQGCRNVHIVEPR